NVSNKLGSDLKSSKKWLAEFIEQRDNLKKGIKDYDEREEALTNLKTVKTKYNELKSEMEAMQNAIEVSHAASNKWTLGQVSVLLLYFFLFFFSYHPNKIFTIRQWCSNNFPQAKEQLVNLYTEVILHLELVNPVIAQN
ncbi:hypothetical protein MKW98_015573, partial [Papaver atlanticum]